MANVQHVDGLLLLPSAFTADITNHSEYSSLLWPLASASLPTGSHNQHWLTYKIRSMCCPWTNSVPPFPPVIYDETNIQGRKTSYPCPRTSVPSPACTTVGTPCCSPKQCFRQNSTDYVHGRGRKIKLQIENGNVVRKQHFQRFVLVNCMEYEYV